MAHGASAGLEPLGLDALLQLRLEPHGIAAVESTPGLAAIQVEGAAARDVLANGCALDLRSPDFALGTCTRTRLAQLPVIFDYVDVKPRFELYVGRSHLSYLCSWLNDAAVGLPEPIQSQLNHAWTLP
jgi:heterotetrameric sarcosine oxidase gamma subunit